MDEDIRRRFNLSEGQPRKPFRLAAEQGPLVKTKDNAQPVIPPPRTTFIPHPQLAPPGMMGARLLSDAAEWKERRKGEFDLDREAGKTFKPFGHGKDKSRGWER